MILNETQSESSKFLQTISLSIARKIKKYEKTVESFFHVTSSNSRILSNIFLIRYISLSDNIYIKKASEEYNMDGFIFIMELLPVIAVNIPMMITNIEDNI